MEKDVFWNDYNIDAAAIKKIVCGNNEYEKRFLFSKILYNSSNVINDLRIFDISFLKLHLDEFLKSAKDRRMINRIKIIKFFLLGEKIEIPELKWNI